MMATPVYSVKELMTQDTRRRTVLGGAQLGQGGIDREGRRQERKKDLG
jgi:hypothetical protein